MGPRGRHSRSVASSNVASGNEIRLKKLQSGPTEMSGFRLSRLLLTLAVVCVCNSSVLAQIQLDRFFPPSVGVGQSTAIKAEGKFPKWPIRLTTDTVGVSVQAAEKSGMLQVVVKNDATPGVVWIRGLDDNSASGLVPLLVEPIDPMVEVEPNDHLGTATEAELPCVVAGRLSKSGEVDTYRVFAKKGRKLVVSVMANRWLQSPMDAVLQVVDAEGHVLAQADDQRGLDPQLVFMVEQDQALFIRLFAFPETPNSTIGFAGAETFVYQLQMTTDAFVDHVLPLSGELETPDNAVVHGWNLSRDAVAKNGNAKLFDGEVMHVPAALGWQYQGANPAGGNDFFESDDLVVIEKLPCSFSGQISDMGEVDRVRLAVTKGSRCRVAVHSRRSGMILDSVLRVVDLENEKELGRNDDMKRGEYDARVDFVAERDGQVEVQISDLVDGFGMRHAYTIVASIVEPSVEATVAANHFALKAGESLEVPITVTRLDGYAMKVQFSVADLPGGVTCATIVSEAKGDSAKAVKLKLVAQDDLVYQGPIQIKAVGLADDNSVAGEPFHVTHELAKMVRIDKFWLTVAP